MTTAITRPDLHNESIKKFYDYYYIKNKNNIDNDFNIYHIINIDYPEKLKKFFTVIETIDNFNNIIPDSINKYFITPENCSFLNAFKNIMYKINELDISDNNNIYWWFEDDWMLTKDDFNFFDIIKKFTNFNSCALTMTSNAQIGSFRGGPLMNKYYFDNYFNIEKLGYMNTTCDPEKQVARYMGAKGSIFFSKEKQIIRELKEYDNKIIILLCYINTNFNKIKPDFGISYYQNKFNTSIIFEYHVINIIDNVYYYIKYNLDVNLTDKKEYKKIDINILYNIFYTKSIIYTIIKPFIFEDIGRNYALKYNLIKSWNKIGDLTTYS